MHERGFQNELDVAGMTRICRLIAKLNYDMMTSPQADRGM